MTPSCRFEDLEMTSVVSMFFLCKFRLDLPMSPIREVVVLNKADHVLYGSLQFCPVRCVSGVNSSKRS